MLQAMIHGKLTREEEGMEDLLTSNIFGLLKYLPPGTALFPFLNLAQNPFSGLQLVEWLLDALALEEMHFWPTFSAPGCQACEPDLDLLIRNCNGSRTRLIIEAKYKSRKSSEASSSELPPNDQLAREFDTLRTLCEREGIEFFAVVYLTADYSCPLESLEQSVREYREKRGSDPNIYWLSWRVIEDVLVATDCSGSDICRDILDLLYYLNLTRFRELRMPEILPRVWEFKQIEQFWTWRALKIGWMFEEKQKMAWSWEITPIPDFLKPTFRE